MIDKKYRTKISSYDSIQKFVTALKDSGTKRLHTLYTGGFLGLGDSGLVGVRANWTASFVHDNGSVHGYITYDTDKGLVDRTQPIYSLIKKIGVPEVDGIVRVSERNFAIYQIFQTESPENTKKVQASFDAWQNAALSLPIKGTIVQYLKNDSEVLVDVTKGKFHLLTTLDGEGNRNLESVLDVLKAYTTQDNTPVLNWYMDITNE